MRQVVAQWAAAIVAAIANATAQIDARSATARREAGHELPAKASATLAIWRHLSPVPCRTHSDRGVGSQRVSPPG